MQLLYLKFLSDYKQFKGGQLITFSSGKDDKIDNYILNISMLVGRNGSGKTTVMSIIAQFFYHIERYNGKLNAEVEISYKIGVRKRKRTVILRHKANIVTISVDNIYDNIQIIPKKDPHNWDYKIIDKEKSSDLFDVFAQYMPSTVVTSVFSMHGEYPNKRPANFDGLELIADRSITRIYGDNHYGLGSISRGIIRFLRLYLAKGSKIRSLLGLFDLKFNDRILIKKFSDDVSDQWITVDKIWLDKNDVTVQMEEILLNDIEFVRDDNMIRLSNMSSGEKMLLLRAISILEAIEQNALIIIEEPELHLDPVWNRQMITLFRTLYSSYRAHMIIATHDYAMINSVVPSRLIFLEKGRDKSVANTFLASYDELFMNLYGNSYRQNKVERDFLNDLNNRDLNDLREIYVEMGNSIYKYLVYKRIKSLEQNVESN